MVLGCGALIGLLRVAVVAGVYGLFDYFVVDCDWWLVIASCYLFELSWFYCWLWWLLIWFGFCCVMVVVVEGLLLELDCFWGVVCF